MKSKSGNTTNGTNSIDFSSISLRELRQLLPSTKGVDIPSEIWIRENAAEILCGADFEDTHIDVYRNGFYTFTRDKRTSILRVDGFHQVRYGSVTGSTVTIQEADYIDSPYFIGLSINGEDQWACNAEKRRNRNVSLSLNADDGVEDKEAVVDDFSDALVEADEKKEQTRRLHAAMEKLSDRQREIVRLYYWGNMSQEQIALKLGIRRQGVSKVISQAIKKLEKFF